MHLSEVFCSLNARMVQNHHKGMLSNFFFLFSFYHRIKNYHFFFSYQQIFHKFILHKNSNKWQTHIAMFDNIYHLYPKYSDRQVLSKQCIPTIKLLLLCSPSSDKVFPLRERNCSQGEHILSIYSRYFIRRFLVCSKANRMSNKLSLF